ncbi:MAG: heavy metal translocating P-type ATPase [Anaerotardibacter sp.]
MPQKLKRELVRISIALVLFVVALLLPLETWLDMPYVLYAEFAIFLIPYLIVGYDVLYRAGRNILNGQVFDENFLMSIATIGAFLLVLFPDSNPHMAEGAAVMIFYQVGEFFQDYAVGRSRKSISDLMDIAPDFANISVDGKLVQVDPYEVEVGDQIIVKAGERIPLDGVIISGETQLDTSALTGESVPRSVSPGSEVLSGCINLSGTLTIRVTKPFEESTVSRILELVENASDKKARTENFITRFARYYTPIVTLSALAIAVVPPLVLGDSFATWIERGLTFLVVSCPCALVISVPLSFFGGIGGASRLGVLIKGSNYLEVLAKADTVVFDKTGTLTQGKFSVTQLCPEQGIAEEDLLFYAAQAEAFSTHPIAVSIREACKTNLSEDEITNVTEKSGHGVSATVQDKHVSCGNAKYMTEQGINLTETEHDGTLVHVAVDGTYYGYLIIADALKADAAQAIQNLRTVGIKKTVMLTGDSPAVAKNVASALGIDEYHAGLLPEDKVFKVEELLAKKTGKESLAFVGDGINDAPVLTRADIGIAMGAMGSDAAIEAADVVLMDDKPSNIATAINIARKTMSIVWQNIIFALGVKFAILILAALGIANMWLAVFGDVGVCIIAVLNAMRAMNVKKYRS